MALYDRLVGRTDAGLAVPFKIPVHGFSSVIAEFGRGRITGPQAQQAMVEMSGSSLDSGEVVEAQTLLATITGSVTARLARCKEIDDVLIIAESGALVYDTPSKVRARLGV